MIQRTLIMAILLVGVDATTHAQLNCLIYTDSACHRACVLYNRSDSFPQGSRRSQQLLDSAIQLCPSMAYAWREMGVAYLKRGDFFTWRKYIDKAAALKPEDYLPIRGWCRFKFLRDYEGALEDLHRSDSLPHYILTRSGDGYWNIYTMMALCYRELGRNAEALQFFNQGIDSVITQYGYVQTGMFDYLYRGVLKLRMKDYSGALADFDQQEKRCDNYMETPYYRGLAYLGLGNTQKATQQLQEAARIYKEGYHFNDPYCEMPDAVYLSDIEAALASIPKPRKQDMTLLK